ncbi:MAG: NAD-binding protein [Defluviitaleaceae bacterium]|nr:NAD-binding protein [Defluviitaleaceae bacterium]
MPIYLIWPLTIALFFVFMVGVLFLMTRSRRFVKVICSIFFAVAVLGGFVFYSYSYLSSDMSFTDALYSTVRGILSTARMFSINDNYDFFSKENIWVQIVFWLCHVSALIVIQAALFALFGKKLIESFRLRFGLHKEVFIIKGCDKYALMLGENIATKDDPKGQPDAKRLIVFLIEEDDDMNKIKEKVTHIDGLVIMPDRKNDLLNCLKKTGLGKRRRRKTKYSMIFMLNSTSAADGTVHAAEYANARNVTPDSLNVFVFVLFEWDRKEIEMITHEKDGERRKYPYTINIVRERDLMVRQMIKEHPPCDCASFDFNENGETAHNFTVLILGFGTVGQQALLRLMMNGQFVGSRMRAIIVDREIDHLREHFLHYYPSVKLCCDIEFERFDVRDEEYFSFLENENDLDYIVVAINDDEISKQIALDTRLHYERRKIAKLPFIAIYEKNGSLPCAKQDELNDKIFSFGCRDAIYNESVIIREETDLMAKAVNNAYAEMYGGKPWHELDWFLQESNRASADFIPAMLKLARLKESDLDIKDTLTDNPNLEEILAQTEHLRWMAFHAAMGYNPINTDEMRRRFENYPGEKNTREHLDFCRRDTKARLHACLVPWDKLDGVRDTYRELAGKAGNVKEQKRDFKDNDRDIVKNIPKFIKAAKS